MHELPEDVSVDDDGNIILSSRLVITNTADDCSLTFIVQTVIMGILSTVYCFILFPMYLFVMANTGGIGNLLMLILGVICTVALANGWSYNVRLGDFTKIMRWAAQQNLGYIKIADIAYGKARVVEWKK